MIRLKWYRFISKFDAESLAKKLNNLKFSHTSPDGFQISSFRNESIEAKYIEKLDYEENLRDPFGEIITSKRVIYRETQFKIFFQKNTLEITNPGRSLTSLIMKLGEISRFSCSVEPINIDIQSIAGINKTINSNFANTSISISQLNLGDGTVGKIIASGGSRIKESVDRFIGDKDHQISSMTFKSASKDIIASFTISRDATLKATGKDSAKIADILRSEILNLI